MSIHPHSRANRNNRCSCCSFIPTPFPCEIQPCLRPPCYPINCNCNCNFKSKKHHKRHRHNSNPCCNQDPCVYDPRNCCLPIPQPCPLSLLRLNVVANPPTVTRALGATETITVTLSNPTPNIYTGLFLIVDLPSPTQFTWTSSSGTCTSQTTPISIIYQCSVGSIVPGGSVIATYTTPVGLGVTPGVYVVRVKVISNSNTDLELLKVESATFTVI